MRWQELPSRGRKRVRLDGSSAPRRCLTRRRLRVGQGVLEVAMAHPRCQQHALVMQASMCEPEGEVASCRCCRALTRLRGVADRCQRSLLAIKSQGRASLCDQRVPSVDPSTAASVGSMLHRACSRRMEQARGRTRGAAAAAPRPHSQRAQETLRPSTTSFTPRLSTAHATAPTHALLSRSSKPYHLSLYFNPYSPSHLQSSHPPHRGRPHLM